MMKEGIIYDRWFSLKKQCRRIGFGQSFVLIHFNIKWSVTLLYCKLIYILLRNEQFEMLQPELLSQLLQSIRTMPQLRERLLLLLQFQQNVWRSHSSYCCIHSCVHLTGGLGCLSIQEVQTETAAFFPSTHLQPTNATLSAQLQWRGSAVISQSTSRTTQCKPLCQYQSLWKRQSKCSIPQPSSLSSQLTPAHQLWLLFIVNSSKKELFYCIDIIKRITEHQLLFVSLLFIIFLNVFILYLVIELQQRGLKIIQSLWIIQWVILVNILVVGRIWLIGLIHGIAIAWIALRKHLSGWRAGLHWVLMVLNDKILSILLLPPPFDEADDADDQSYEENTTNDYSSDESTRGGSILVIISTRLCYPWAKAKGIAAAS